MTEAYRRLTIGALLALCLVSAARADAAEARYAGRPVVDVLLELRAPGVDFIYSSELVPESMRVLAEPQAAGPLPIAREILAAHGLTLSAVRPGLYAVTRQMPPPTEVGYSAPEPATAEPPTQLAEVVVSTSRYAFDRSGTFSSVSIAGDTLASQPVLGEDAIRALGRLPGIAQSGISAQSSVRGGESGEVLMLLDGFPLRQAFHMPGYQSVFGVLDPGLVADAEIFTGGFPVRYGNRMGGVFDLQTIEADHEPRTALGLSVFNGLARRGGRVEEAGVDWLTALRVGTLKPFIEAFAHDAGSPSYADVYARATHGDPDRVRLSANFLWSRDELSIRREGQDEEAEIESRNRYLWLRADHDWDSGVRASLWLGFSSIGSFRAGTVDNPGIASGSVTDRRSSDYREARGRITWQPHARHWIEGGFEWTDEDARYRYAAEATYAEAVADLFSRDVDLARASELSPERERLALFAAHRWQIAPVLISELGLRAQRIITAGTSAEDWILDPRVNLHWRIGPATDLRMHWGRFHQTDEVHELKVEDGLTAFPETQGSDQVIVGFDHRLGGNLALRLEGFRKSQSDPRPHFENLLDPLTLIPEIAPDRQRIAPTSAEIRGAELSLVSQLRDLAWWAGLTWSEAFDRVDAVRVPRSWDQSWAVNAGIDWTRRNWRFGAVASAHRGWPTTRVLDTSLGERNAVRFQPRVTLDLRAEYRKPLAVGSLAVTFEVTNAINIGNTCCAELRANSDNEGNVTFTTRKSDWLPVVPSVGVLWEF
jgi:outer membrane cobalamin receptor